MSLLREKNIKLEILRDLNMVCCLYDKEQLKFSIIEILKNSIDAIENKSEKWIRLYGKTDEKFFYLYIQDSGEGIDHHIMNDLFTPFHTTKDPSLNMGLGLKLTKKALMKFGADLNYDEVQKNTTFVISIPLKVAKTEESAA